MSKRRTTLKDIAEAVGVHSSTVSRALAPKTRCLITPEIAERIVAVARERGYRPNAIAASLRTRRTMTVGVVVPDITNPVFPPILRGIEDTLAAQGYIAVIVNSDGDPQRESVLIDTLRARGVDGLILASAQREDPAISRAVEERIPIVTVNRRVEDPNVSSVTNDEASGIRQAVRHMVRFGHREIAHIAGPHSLSTGLMRHKAFLASMRANGLAPDRRLVVSSTAFNESEGERCCRLLLRRSAAAAADGFTAIVCANDRLAIGAIRALRSEGHACPRDISVSGYNDMDFVDRIDPPLTTVRIQKREAGARAAAILLDRLRNPCHRPERVILPVELVVRGSTAPARSRHLVLPSRHVA
ncbi:MAG TPA: LacI family DNA-binding transcriptional regulator [Geminicoccaceae bacterium]|nr:LacI family DNA-binding transcriptional regulator [Geminicoccaceae bacterium]